MSREDRSGSDAARREAAVRALEAARREEVSPPRGEPVPPDGGADSRRVWWVVGAVVLVVLAIVFGALAFSGSGDGDDDRATDSSEVTVDTESSSAGSRPVDSTVGSSVAAALPPPVGLPAPPLDLTGDDLSAVALQILAFRSWLLANPDPALTSEIFVPSSPAFESFRDELTDLREAGHVVLFEGFRPRVTSTLVFGNAEVDVAISFDARVVYDSATGAEVAREPGGTLPVTMSLEQGPDQRWRATELAFFE